MHNASTWRIAATSRDEQVCCTIATEIANTSLQPNTQLTTKFCTPCLRSRTVTIPVFAAILIQYKANLQTSSTILT